VFPQKAEEEIDESQIWDPDSPADSSFVSDTIHVFSYDLVVGTS
jgi:hypothetical protein